MTNLFQLIRQSEQISNEMTIAWTRQFPHDLGVSEALILSSVDEKPSKPSELALQHGYTKAAITNIAGKLEKINAITKRPDPTDGRAFQLHITPTGSKILTDAKKVGHTLREHIFTQLTEEERAQFYTIQEKLLRILQQTIDEKNNR